jgi:hypothetical protein
VNDLQSFEDLGEDGDKAVADAVVAAPLRHFFAVENVGTFGIDGGPADANGEVGAGVDVKMEFALEGDGEEVTMGMRWDLLLRDMLMSGYEDGGGGDLLMRWCEGWLLDGSCRFWCWCGRPSD